ncbi:PREDICTED: prefoldin subunit 4 [Myotis davidii]|uniref:prefoldin subunit 4 n=1 Tax=Myotis davidii TaxID=225400 RepID=UPI0007672109|nr:PREDICTED: prefoldin subunit 4 [Myotis davidii]
MDIQYFVAILGMGQLISGFRPNSSEQVARMRINRETRRLFIQLMKPLSKPPELHASSWRQSEAGLLLYPPLALGACALFRSEEAHRTSSDGRQGLPCPHCREQPGRPAAQTPLCPWRNPWADKAAEDVNVTFEDQQKINKFARNTSRITELKEEIDVKKKQLQNLEDACEDIMLADEDCLMIPYQIGDVFISHSQEETQDMLEEAKKNLQEEIDALESRVESIQRVLADLKVQLYAKFGSNINLEADES